MHPGRHEKVLTSWNGLMLAAFAEAARAFSPSPGSGRGGQGVRAETYRQVAERNAEFLLREFRQDDGRLLRTWEARPERVEGAGEARLSGYLEDYAYLVEGLLELYQTTFDPHWLLAAQQLADTMLEHSANLQGTLYDTSDDHETLITRPRDLQDNATPSANAIAVTALLKLAGFTNEVRYVDIAHEALAQMQGMMAQYPLGFGQWLQAPASGLSKPKEIAIVGDPDSADTQALLNVARNSYQPFQVVGLGASGPEGARVPLLYDRGLVDGQSTAYVCRSFACQAPVTKPEGLRAQLLGG